MLQNGVGQSGRSRERGHFAQLQAYLQQLDAGYTKGFSHQRGSGDILRAQAEDDVRVLRNLHALAFRRALPRDGICRQIAIDSVDHF